MQFPIFAKKMKKAIFSPTAGHLKNTIFLYNLIKAYEN